jgi:hypothetical protein
MNVKRAIGGAVLTGLALFGAFGAGTASAAVSFNNSAGPGISQFVPNLAERRGPFYGPLGAQCRPGELVRPYVSNRPVIRAYFCD